MSATFSCPVSTYQQFTPTAADGWRKEALTFSREHTAVVVMHATTPPPADAIAGWHRAVPYLAKASNVLREVFPALMRAVRNADLPVFHVPGMAAAPPHQVATDPTWETLQAYRADHVFPGAANQNDVVAGRSQRELSGVAAPLPGEGVAETSAALHDLASARRINHLIYLGFALNWCLLMSPGGMVEMKRHGYLCSTVQDAVVTVEPSAQPDGDREMQSALWRVAVEFGFVFASPDLITALDSQASMS